MTDVRSSGSESTRGGVDGLARALPGFAYACMFAVCAQALWQTSLWKAAEPRVMTIAREQFEGGLIRSLTFAGMPFLEKPPLYYDLTAAAFHLAGGPSIFAARVVVALLGGLWCFAVVATARRVGGSRAGLFAGALLVVSPAFAALVRRMGVDIALVTMLSVSMLFLFLAIVEGGKRLDRRWLVASLGAAGLAALSKGIFGTFLFLAPTVAYSFLAHDWRVLRALVRPSSLLLLALPHSLWALVLFDSGGTTYVFEHFVNNTIGRVLHRRFGVGETLDLAYGDVGGTYPWWYYLRFIPTSALPAVLAVPFALREQRRRGGFRAPDPESRLLALCVCWACVPPLLLSFSSYKGRGHLAASSAAIVLIGAVWIARRLRARIPTATQVPPLVATLTLYVFAPAILIAGAFGVPATRPGMYACFAAGGVLLVAASVLALRGRSPGLAIHALVAALAVGYVADLSPAGIAAGDETNTMDPVSRWVAREAGDLPVALYYPRARPRGDRIGWSRENEVATLSYWLGRPVVRLPDPAAVRAYLGSEEPGYFVARRSREEAGGWPPAELPVGWVAIGGNREDVFVLVANRAAATARGGPTSVPPGPLSDSD